MTTGAVLAVVTALLTAGPAEEKSAAGGRLVVLGDTTLWRAHLTWATPVVIDGEGKVKPLTRSKGSGKSATVEPVPVWQSQAPPADWAGVDFDDSQWATISIEQAWQKAGYDYVGVAWYRRWVELSPKPDCVAAELVFKGVDECAWVWVNGVYVGDHDLGPSGWNLPFRLDVTDELKWGEKNLIVVRAMNTVGAGGVWRPVFLDVLRDQMTGRDRP